MTWPAKFGEWTTLAEGLPEPGDAVIIELDSGEVSGGWYCRYGTPCFFEGKRGGYPFRPGSVISWMPMPAAPSASAEHGPMPHAP